MRMYGRSFLVRRTLFGGGMEARTKQSGSYGSTTFHGGQQNVSPATRPKGNTVEGKFARKVLNTLGHMDFNINLFVSVLWSEASPSMRRRLSQVAKQIQKHESQG